MRMPGFTADAALASTRQTYGVSKEGGVLGGLSPVVPQLAIGGVGVTYPPGDDDCYCCTQWIRCPCDLSLG